MAILRPILLTALGGTLKVTVAKGLPPTFSIPVEIKDVAEKFGQLQQWRQLAEYDRTERFLREDVLGLVAQAEVAVDTIESLASSMEKKFFLVCLLAWGTLVGR